ncbi:MAG: hypothetical protein ACR650_08710 [Methylocystis sp.]|jgi:hypothetical protein
MIQNRSQVNGILAAVLSASIVPMHGALAKPKSPTAHKAAVKKMNAPAAQKTDKRGGPKETDGANAPAAVAQ